MQSPIISPSLSSPGRGDLQSFNFAPADSRRAIERISNQLLAALAHNSARLISTSDLDLKVALGCRIGYVGRAIEELRRRSFELDAEHLSGWDVCSGISSAERRESVAGVCEARALSPAALEEIIASPGLAHISQDIASVLRLLDPVKDEPTIMAFHGVQEFLAKALLRSDSSIWNVEAPELCISKPGRPSFLRRGEKADIANVSFEETARDDAHLARLRHFIYVDVEMPVMEICSRNILDFPEMPVQFKLDMARQIWDEARYAEFMREGFERHGVRLGEYAYSANAWKLVVESNSLVERLVVGQIILEGNGLDAGVLIARICRDRADIATALCFESQNVDELTHCRIGHRWLQHLLRRDEAEYSALISRCSEKINQKVPGSAPVAFKARIAAGFPERFVVSLMQTQEH